MNKSFAALALFMIIASLTACSTTKSHNETVATPPVDTNSKPVDQTANTLASNTETGIATNKPANTFTAPTTVSVGGSFVKEMDPQDKIKMSRALDKALGKVTQWKNEVTGISYSIVPNKKVIINGNHFCRQYTMTSSKGDSTQDLNETACIGSDGEWHPVST